jgi:hypothetical protein
MHLVRYPLGGHLWHHLQYLLGLQRLGHEVTAFEHYGWPDSCYDPSTDTMTGDPAYGLAFLREQLDPHGFDRWSYLAQDGTAHGMSREELAEACAEADLLLNLSNVTWAPEAMLARRRVLVDTDPVFTQVGGHGAAALNDHHVFFTYGERVHRAGCDMPTGDVRWLPTRQPMLLDLWRAQDGGEDGPLTTVGNWMAYGEAVHDGRVYGQKDREFGPYLSLPRRVARPLELKVSASDEVRRRLREHGWRVGDPLDVTLTPQDYQAYLRASFGEFSVAKHAYVSTRCGWFSDRSAGYLASGRPVVLQDTGYSELLPVGEGLLPFRSPAECVAQIERLAADPAAHRRAARAVAEECFDAEAVLSHLLERCL